LPTAGFVPKWDELPTAGFVPKWDELQTAGFVPKWDELPTAGFVPKWDELPTAGFVPKWDELPTPGVYLCIQKCAIKGVIVRMLPKFSDCIIGHILSFISSHRTLAICGQSCRALRNEVGRLITRRYTTESETVNQNINLRLLKMVTPTMMSNKLLMAMDITLSNASPNALADAHVRRMQEFGLMVALPRIKSFEWLACVGRRGGLLFDFDVFLTCERFIQSIRNHYHGLPITATLDAHGGYLVVAVVPVDNAQHFTYICNSHVPLNRNIPHWVLAM
jgi:hypothetical protein